MIEFTTGDMVVVDGQKCLVRGREDDAIMVLTPTGKYVTVAPDDIESVYIY